MNNQPLNCHIQPNTPFGAILTPQHPGQKIGDLPVAALRTLAQEHHLLVLRGFDSGFNEAEVLTRYAEQWGEIMMWPFGAVLDVKEHPDARIISSTTATSRCIGMACISRPSPSSSCSTAWRHPLRTKADAPPSSTPRGCWPMRTKRCWISGCRSRSPTASSRWCITAVKSVRRWWCSTRTAGVNHALQ